MANPYIKKANVSTEFEAWQLFELEKCLDDPIYFIKNYVKIQHATKGTVPFDLFDYQIDIVNCIHHNKDSLVLCSRQLGKCVHPSTKITIRRHSSNLLQKVFNFQGNECEISISEFHKMLYLENVQIFDLNNNLKFIEQGDTSDYSIKTENGFVPIKSSFKTVPYKIYEIILENGLSLKCADTHIVIDNNNNELFVKDLSLFSILKTEFGLSKVVKLIEHDDYENMYDLELDSNDHTYYTNGILSHNTTIAAIYILWLAAFNGDKFCVIASKNMSHATDIMAKIKFAYEELPDWLKPGCKFYNRTSIEFDNGSLIRSEATTDKTGRGNSPSILFLDELAFISKRIQETIWASIAPSLSTGGKLVISTTPNGDTDLFSRLWRESLAGLNNFGHVIKLYYEHPERGPGSGYREEMLVKLGELKTRIEIDCEFLSSEALLINSQRLIELRPEIPMLTDNGFDVWNQLDPNMIYLVGIDIATGTGKDFSVIEIFEFPTLLQVAQFRNNNLNIPGLYNKIKWVLNKLCSPIGNKRPEVFWTFERNSVGEAIGALYYSDETPPEYAELINDVPGKLGMNTSNRTKVLACLNLKSLIEKHKNGLNIKSELTIFELKNYISAGGSYAAKSGATDDSIAAILLITRLISHIANFDDNARKVLYEYDEGDYIKQNNENNDEDEPIPFLIV